MTSFDMKTLKVPLGQLPELVQHKVPVTSKSRAVFSSFKFKKKKFYKKFSRT